MDIFNFKITIPVLKFKITLTIYDILLVIILAASLAIRIYLFDYPLNNGEYHRDFIVGSYMLKYHEFPSVGPWSGIFYPLRNSPVYYYFVALLLIPKNDFYFLGYAHIVLQTFTIFIVYLIGKLLFRPPVGLAAAFLYGFSQVTVHQSEYIWHLYAVSLFTNPAFLFLILAHLKKKFAFVLLSIFFMLLAVAIQSSVAVLLPVYFFIIFFILKNQKRQLNYYLMALLFSSILLLIFFLPVVIFHLNKNYDTIEIILKRLTFSPTLVFPNLAKNLFLIFGSFFNSTFYMYANPMLNRVLTVILILSSCFYVLSHKPGRNYLLIIALFCLQIILATSFTTVRIGPRYYTSIFGLFLVFLAQSIFWPFYSKGLKLVGFILLIFFLFVYSLKFYIPPKPNNLSVINPLTEAMAREILDIKKESGFKELNFFHVDADPQMQGHLESLVFWFHLAQKLPYKYFEVFDEGGGSIVYNTKSQYKFLVCKDEYKLICLSSIKKKNYKLVKPIYTTSPYQLFLATRE